MSFLDRGFRKAGLIWQLDGQDVRCCICTFPGMLSRISISSPNVVGADGAVTSSICGWTTSGTFHSVVSFFLSLWWKYSATSLHPGCVNRSSFICFCRKLPTRCCTILEIVPNTQPGSSPSLSLASSGSSSSSPLSSSSSWSAWLASSLRLSLMAFKISSNAVPALLVVPPAFSAFLISYCSWLITVSASSTRFLATAVSISTYSSICFSFSSFLTTHVHPRFSTASFFYDHNLCNSPRAWTVSASQAVLLVFARWHCRVEGFVNLQHLPASCG